MEFGQRGFVICLRNDNGVKTRWTSQIPNLELQMMREAAAPKAAGRRVSLKKPAAAPKALEGPGSPAVATPKKKAGSKKPHSCSSKKELKSTERELLYSQVYHETKRIYKNKGYPHDAALKKGRVAAQKHCKEIFGW